MVVDGNPGLGEENLVEAAPTGDLAQRTHLDARLCHVDDEHGQALVLGQRGVGSGDDDAVVAVVGARGPHLLALEDPFVAVPGRPGGQSGNVGAGARFGEHLAPDAGTADVVGHEPGLLLRSAELVQHRQAHAVGDGQGHVGQVPALDLLVEQFLVPFREARSAELGRERQAAQSGIDHGSLEGPRRGDALRVLVADGSGPVAGTRAVGLEELGHTASEVRHFDVAQFGVVDLGIHGADRTGRPVSAGDRALGVMTGSG